ncbi:MAG: hypothetical protein ABI618_11480, partial [Nitrospirota bacterium]
DKPGKNSEGKELTLWNYDHDHPTLFSEKICDTKLSVVIDASVFFDLLDEENSARRESQSLLADWLAPSIEIYLTDEIFNEINRRVNTQERKKSRGKANNFNILRPHYSEWHEIFSKLRQTFPKKTTQQDSSDLRHLAKTIAKGIKTFVTRDGPLLKNADILYNRFGLSVVRPSDIVLDLNDFKMEEIYQPARFDRSSYQVRHVKAGEVESLLELFQSTTLGERKAEFKDYLGTHLAYPERIETLLILESEANPIGLISFEKCGNDTLKISLLRVRAGLLKGTIARNLILRALHNAAIENRPKVRFADPYFDEEVKAALKEDGFCFNGSDWLKITLPVVETISGLSNMLGCLSLESPLENDYRFSILRNLKISNDGHQIRELAETEKMLWPMKISEVKIPNFIIPIQPRWAKELFDEELSKQNLFPAPPELGLNREAVYYRAKNPSSDLPAYSRILWYVSKDCKYQGTMHIKACSYVDEVAIGKPKYLFKRFRRLGVYDWESIFSLAKNDVNRDIMAIKFSYTESFSSPVPWQKFQDVLKDDNCPSRIQSPHKIPSSTFFKIYRAGTNRHQERKL